MYFFCCSTVVNTLKQNGRPWKQFSFVTSFIYYIREDNRYFSRSHYVLCLVCMLYKHSRIFVFKRFLKLTKLLNTDEHRTNFPPCSVHSELFWIRDCSRSLFLRQFVFLRALQSCPTRDNYLHNINASLHVCNLLYNSMLSNRVHTVMKSHEKS